MLEASVEEIIATPVCDKCKGLMYKKTITFQSENMMEGWACPECYHEVWLED